MLIPPEKDSHIIVVRLFESIFGTGVFTSYLFDHVIDAFVVVCYGTWVLGPLVPIDRSRQLVFESKLCCYSNYIIGHARYRPRSTSHQTNEQHVPLVGESSRRVV